MSILNGITGQEPKTALLAPFLFPTILCEMILSFKTRVTNTQEYTPPTITGQPAPRGGPSAGRPRSLESPRMLAPGGGSCSAPGPSLASLTGCGRVRTASRALVRRAWGGWVSRGLGRALAPLTSEGEGLCFSPRNGACLKGFKCRSLRSPSRGGDSAP